MASEISLAAAPPLGHGCGPDVGLVAVALSQPLRIAAYACQNPTAPGALGVVPVGAHDAVGVTVTGVVTVLVAIRPAHGLARAVGDSQHGQEQQAPALNDGHGVVEPRQAPEEGLVAFARLVDVFGCAGREGGIYARF